MSESKHRGEKFEKWEGAHRETWGDEFMPFILSGLFILFTSKVEEVGKGEKLSSGSELGLPVK